MNSYYYRISELSLITNLISEGYTQKQIYEAVVLPRGGGIFGNIKRFIGSREDFKTGYNAVIDRDNILRKARGQPLLRRWGEPKRPWSEPYPPPKADSDVSSKSGTAPDKPKDSSDPSTAMDPVVRAQMQSNVAAKRYNRALSGEQGKRDALAKQIRAMRKAKTLQDIAQEKENADFAEIKKRDSGIAKTIGKAKTVDPAHMGTLTRGERGDLIRAKNKPIAASLAARKAELGIRDSIYYGYIANMIRESFQLNEKKDPCWKGYEAVGMKMKGGRKVPNCVPKSK